jgi:hypothetical protein
MSLMIALLVLWGVITAALAVVVIYRSMVSLHEDDQLFLSSGEAQLAKDQQQVVARLDRSAPCVRYLGAASGLLALVIVGLWLYEGFTSGAAAPK